MVFGDISLTAIGLVLLSALMHASWNAMIKGGTDKLTSAAMISLFAGVFSLPITFFVPALPQNLWLLLFCSTLIHMGYFYLVAYCYQLGDYSLAYPAMRGIAPVFVAGMNIAFIGDAISPMKYAGILVICAGLGLLAFSAVKRSKSDLSVKTLLFALLNGLVIACYTVLDGYGARLAPVSATFCLWFFVINAPMFLVLCAVLRGKEPLVTGFKSHWKKQAIGGALQVTCYMLVLWVMTTQPIAFVSALRETSVLFAAIIGAVFLKEKFGIIKTTACVLTAAGIVMMRF